ncbi:hypothetical protein DL766_004961 [Monosporascus sp. MC13-8B]|uniref:Carboxylic ester hydrolase n=1 Tax=Monosporascus cannonballus TaxID=155416 RepID=A0ABY0H281_9PEZI|nr:hypothetical protein DL762_006384 [Monosporascus cannonballus]RYO97007.1 hypothetical protein DL763_002944 [Monosporascus cannonballus]RYP30289.1 hypothetical protein DL766_004961 [Monosporascus sp. MC13-8B]
MPNFSTNLLLLFAGPLGAPANNCRTEIFDAIVANIPDATVNYVEAVPRNGSFGDAETNLSFPVNATQLPALCAVGINVKSSASSSFNFGLFLPEGGAWNERLMTTGNVGYGGGINWLDMGTLSHEIVNTYYATPEGIRYSYYAACSTGGRQGLKEIYLNPDSFDGISVGAPAWWSTHLAGALLYWGLLNYPASDPKHISPSLFPAIVAEVREKCDGQDGLIDGIVSDAHGCEFNFDALLCAPDSDPLGCLTPEQLTTIKRFHGDWVAANGTFIYPGATLGVDPTVLLADGTDAMLQHGYYTNWVFNDTEWDYTQFSHRDVLFADTIDPGKTSADDYDLSTFHKRGGKILHHHGDADYVIPSTSSVYYYKEVSNALTGKNIDLDDFYRFFLVPGMDHCYGSPNAPWYVTAAGQSLTGATHSVPGFEDAEHDVILALMRWVEEDVAPEKIIATKFRNETVSAGIQSQRPICAYPRRAKYISGDPDKESNWECRGL